MKLPDGDRVSVKDGAVDLLNSLIWHDSVLYGVQLVRARSADQVQLDLRLLDDWEHYLSRRARIVFENCYCVRANMNWGVTCMSDGEMISDGVALQDSEQINTVRSKWKQDLETTPLAEFDLELASTGSTVEIVFRAVRICYDSTPEKHSAPDAHPMKPDL